MGTAVYAAAIRVVCTLVFVFCYRKENINMVSNQCHNIIQFLGGYNF